MTNETLRFCRSHSAIYQNRKSYILSCGCDGRPGHEREGMETLMTNNECDASYLLRNAKDKHEHAGIGATHRRADMLALEALVQDYPVDNKYHSPKDTAAKTFVLRFVASVGVTNAQLVRQNIPESHVGISRARGLAMWSRRVRAATKQSRDMAIAVATDGLGLGLLLLSWTVLERIHAHNPLRRDGALVGQGARVSRLPSSVPIKDALAAVIIDLMQLCECRNARHGEAEN